MRMEVVDVVRIHALGISANQHMQGTCGFAMMLLDFMRCHCREPFALCSCHLLMWTDEL